MDEKKPGTEKPEKQKSPFLSTHLSLAVITLITGLVALAALILCAVTVSMRDRDAKELRTLRQEKENDAAVAASRLRDEEEAREASEAENEVLNAELQSIKEELEQTKEALARLSGEEESSEVLALRSRVEELENRIEAWKQERNTSPFSLSSLVSPVTTLDILLSSSAPLQTETYETTDSYGNPAVGERQVYPDVAFLLCDLDLNAVYERNGSKTFDSAGVRALAYALALLDAEKAENALPEDMRSERKYDLDTIYTFSSADVVSGAGVLKNAKAGDQFRYAELLTDSLQYADATAAAILEKKFGTEVLTSYLTALGTSVMGKDPGRTCTGDVLLLLRAAYDGIGEEGGRAALLKDALCSSVTTSLSSVPALSSVPILHGYGRSDSAYHDFGLVLAPHPYAVIFLSDVKEKSDKFTDYLKKVENAGLELEAALRP